MTNDTHRVVALIEDEPLLRVPLAKALAEAGYRVISAASAPEGLELLEDPAIDIAVIDLRLPGRLDGVALAKEARQRRPDLRVIFVSAQPPDEATDDLGAFLQKPFASEDLLREVRSCLAAPAKPLAREKYRS